MHVVSSPCVLWLLEHFLIALLKLFISELLRVSELDQQVLYEREDFFLCQYIWCVCLLGPHVIDAEPYQLVNLIGSLSLVR